MSVYIPGMEMPKSCHECVAGYGGCCFVAPAEADGICPDHGRADFCPLVPVPDHGDLIDRDETLKKLSPEQIKNVKPDMTWEEIYELNVLDIVTMPAIIPAEEGK